MYGDELILVLQKTVSFARQYGSREADLVHFLVVLLEEDSVVQSLRLMGVSSIDLRLLLLNHLAERAVPHPLPEPELDLDPSILLEAVLTNCRIRYGFENITIDNILDEILDLQDHDSQDFYAVSAIYQLIHIEARNSYNSTDTKSDNEINFGSDSSYGFDSSQAFNKTSDDTILEFTVDLVHKAKSGHIDPVYGRDEQVERIIEILSRRKKNNPILLGEPGVGKTAIVEGLALKIASGDIPDHLKSIRILSLNTGHLVAGTRNRGDFEERLTQLIDILENNPNFVLFIDEIHSIVGGIRSINDSAEIMKPALASGKFRCIGATTHGEYIQYFSKNPAMARRFQPVAVPEPTKSEATHIIQRLLPVYAEHHKINYEDDIAPLAVELSCRFILDRFLPDKAIDVIDEAGATAAARSLTSVDKELVHEVVSRMAGVNLASGYNDSGDMADALNKRIVGQHAACEKIAIAASRSKFGLSSNNRSRCSLLFVGPSGTGKRFTVSQIADIQKLPIFKMDMSNFREAHSITRLIGSPPGYVGYESGGQLTEAIRRNPMSLVLIERAETAHPNVLSVITNAIETGVITDSCGNNIPFSNVTVIFTKDDAAKRNSFGFHSSNLSSDPHEAPDFPTEVLDVIDDVITFKTMSESELETIAKAKVQELSAQLEQFGVQLELNGDIASTVALMALRNGGSTRELQRAFRQLAEYPIINASPQKGQIVSLNAISQKSTVEVR